MEISYSGNLDLKADIRAKRDTFAIFGFWSSQVKLLITDNAFCIVQRATAQSKTGIFREFGVAEAPPGIQAGWSDCMYFGSLQ
jgi:hypothetical protein